MSRVVRFSENQANKKQDVQVNLDFRYWIPYLGHIYTKKLSDSNLVGHQYSIWQLYEDPCVNE